MNTISKTLYRDVSIILSSLQSDDPVTSAKKACKLDLRILILKLSRI